VWARHHHEHTHNDFTKEQIDELKKTLETALNSIAGSPGGTVCTTNVEVSDALDLANDRFGGLQRRKITASPPMTLHYSRRTTYRGGTTMWRAAGWTTLRFPSIGPRTYESENSGLPAQPLEWP
jgi:hypothetical protein